MSYYGRKISEAEDRVIKAIQRERENTEKEMNRAL